MSLIEKLISKEEKIAIIGLGYVGLPLAVAFSEKFDVVGFDLNKSKIEKYQSGIDVTNEVGSEKLKKVKMTFTSDKEELKKCKFHVVAVPTPVSADKTPDLSPVISASELIGENLVKGSIVVFESTVYPGVTEEVCIPILENKSGLKAGIDFKVGYSPERINPGDKENTLEKIVKVVSGMDEETLIEVASTYETIILAGVHKAPSIKVAEASKVIENSQRDINIAFMNELSIVFNKMEIDTNAVLEAAGTKWNFLKFSPGLVGGHCIGVDPYYFIYKAEQLGYHSQIILSGRRINDDMPSFVSENVIKKLVKSDRLVKGATITVMGVTFKEDCPDSRNSKVIDIINELKDYGVNVLVVDPVVNEVELFNEYGLELTDFNDINDSDAVIVAVPHEEFLNLDLDILGSKFKKNDNKQKNILIDVKGIYAKREGITNFDYWSL